MQKTLAQLRAEKSKNLPTRRFWFCLDQDLLADVQRLREERAEIARTSPAMQRQAEDDDQDEDAPKRPRKMADQIPPRVAEVDKELENLYSRMREASGELVIRAIPGGAWLRWKDEHPAREGNEVDAELAWGRCNALDLLRDIGQFIESWNGAPVSDEDREWLAETIAPADMRDMISRIVEMHEVNVSAPKASAVSSETPKRDSASS